MKRLSLVAAMAAALVTLAFGGTASAAVVVGEVAPATPTASCLDGPFDVIPGGTATGLYRVPVNGLITSWSTNAAAGAGQELALKVFRPLGGGKFLVVGHDGPRPLAPATLNTFPTAIPVLAGDLVGDNDGNASPGARNACSFASGVASDLFIFPPKGNSADGTTVQEEGNEEGQRVNVRATLQPAPTIASISPSSGLTSGGATVLISGVNFVGVKSVLFGAVPATFLVNSESLITATAPPGAAAGSVPVTVTASAGAATSPLPFTYAAPTCTVPKLKGKTLKSAKKRIRAADCRVGKLTKTEGATANNGEVVKQVPKPGATVPAETKVKVTLAP